VGREEQHAMDMRPSRVRRVFAGPGHGERGQTNVEYALIVAGVAVLLILGVFALGGGVSDKAGGSVSARDGVLKPPTVRCDSSYSGACVPPPPPDLNCDDLRARGTPLPVRVVGSDPHGLDPDGDGVGC
jgi:Flp pilus assembly pilin Flp